jgi:ABC-type multidrug transport system fused ATPase/permease subunit
MREEMCVREEVERRNEMDLDGARASSLTFGVCTHAGRLTVGDVALSVDGVAISDDMPAFRLMAKVPEDCEATFEFRRASVAGEEEHDDVAAAHTAADQEQEGVKREAEEKKEEPVALQPLCGRRRSIPQQRTSIVPVDPSSTCYFEADGTRVGFYEAGDVPAFRVEMDTFKYDGVREILHDVKFSIPQGARVGVLGKSVCRLPSLAGTLRV